MRLRSPWLIFFTSLRYSRVSGLYMVYALLHPVRPNGGAQVLWNVTVLSIPDSLLFSFRLRPHFLSISLVSLMCVCYELGSVWSLSVRTDVLYMHYESNHSLFLSLLSEESSYPRIHNKGIVWLFTIPQSWDYGAAGRDPRPKSQNA